MMVMYASDILAIDNSTSEECTEYNKQYWMYLNMLRTNPKDFIPFLEDMLTRFWSMPLYEKEYDDI